jgi:adenylosuccinate synthase
MEEFREYAQLEPLVVDAGLLLDQARLPAAKILWRGPRGPCWTWITEPIPMSPPPTRWPAAGPWAAAWARASSDLRGGDCQGLYHPGGGWPLPHGNPDATGDWIREKGREYGTTTGRPRRIGWLDTVVLNHARRVNNLKYLALNPAGCPERPWKPLKICTSYELQGRKLTHIPALLSAPGECRPCYMEMPGWDEDLSRPLKNTGTFPWKPAAMWSRWKKAAASRWPWFPWAPAPARPKFCGKYFKHNKFF